MDINEGGLIEGVQAWMKYLEPTLQTIKTYSWRGRDQAQFWEFLQRGIIKRQEEAILAILEMDKAGHGHFGVTMLRPAYEELLWIEYLYKHAELAPQIVLLMTRREVADSLEAQNQYVGAKAMDALGFKQKYVKSRLAKLHESQAELKSIGKSLGWRNDEPPGAAFLARQVKREKEYNFIYRATSRYVHFSTHEIGRRVWGKRGQVEIGSNSFSRYWRDFAISWSFRIFIEVVTTAKPLWEGIKLEDTPEELMHFLKAITPVPIITKGELESW